MKVIVVKWLRNKWQLVNNEIIDIFSPKIGEDISDTEVHKIAEGLLSFALAMTEGNIKT